MTTSRQKADESYAKGMAKLKEARQQLDDAISKTVTPDAALTREIMGTLLEAQLEFAAQGAYEFGIAREEAKAS